MRTKKLTQTIILLVVLAHTAACAPAAENPAPTPSPPVPTQPPATPTPAPPQDPTAVPSPIPEDALKILFVGNSFTFFYNMPDTFTNMMLAGGHPVYVQVAAEPGYRLSQHLESQDTLAAIGSQAWDYVILQENSHNLRSDRHLEKNMYPAVRQLDARIKENGTQTVLFLTWADKYGYAEEGYASLAEMQAYHIQAYNQIAAEIGAQVAPAGPAWMLVYNRHPELELWDGDANHPSELGAYLNACVFYAFFTQTSPEESGYTHNLPPETAQMLQASAAAAVLESP